MIALLIALGVLAGVAAGVALARYGSGLLPSRDRKGAVTTSVEQALQPAPNDRALNELREHLEILAAQIEDLRREPTPVPAPQPAPRSGLNLSKRSQALRMHRRGDSPEQVAAALEVPLQEIGLLLKVHRIVMSTV